MSQTDEVDQVTRDASERDEMIKNVKAAYDSANKSKFSYILLGKALLKARQICRANFYADIPEAMIPKKQVQRYMRLVTRKSCYEQLSKPPSTNDSSSNLKVDDNIASITEADLLTLKNPSLNKIILMKELETPEDFKEVLMGDDTKYNELIRKKEEAAVKVKADNSEKKVTEFLNTGMTTEEYDKYKSAGIDHAIKSILRYRDEQKKLQKELEGKEQRIEEKEQKIVELQLALQAHKEEIEKLSQPLQDKVA